MSKNEQFPSYQPHNELLEVLPYPKGKERTFKERFKLRQLEFLGKMQNIFKNPKTLKGMASNLKNSIENQQLKPVKSAYQENNLNNGHLEGPEIGEFTDETSRRITLLDVNDLELKKQLITQSGDIDPIAMEEMDAANLLNVLQNSKSIDWVYVHEGRGATIVLSEENTQQEGDELITRESSSTLFIDHNLRSQTHGLRYSETSSENGGDNPVFFRKYEEVTLEPTKKLCTIKQTIDDEPVRGYGQEIMSHKLLKLHSIKSQDPVRS